MLYVFRNTGYIDPVVLHFVQFDPSFSRRLRALFDIAAAPFLPKIKTP
jgi:hypothetical protein